MEALDHEEEAKRLLELHGHPDNAGAFPRCLDEIKGQLAVIQTRSQLLLTLATITLTITGFSGPAIAASGPLARWSMALGLIFVITSVIILIYGSLGIRWISQWIGTDPLETLKDMICYRERKTLHYRMEVTFLALGLISYVTAMIAFVGAQG